MTKTANILDPIHDGLSPKVFTHPEKERPVLKSHHHAWIQHTVHTALERAGYEQIGSWLSLVFTGSLTTYQYSNESDVDVSLFVDVEHFPDWSRAEMIGVMVDTVDGVKLPGTPYPMQCFVVAPEVGKHDLYQPGLRSGYDLDANEWIVPPERSRVHDVEKEMYAAYVAALEAADKMERLLTFEPDKAVMYWHQIHKRRRRDHQAGKGDYSPSNIVYKMLFNRGLTPQIAEVSGEYIAKTAAGQVSKWVFNPHTNELHVGRLAAEEGEVESHFDLVNQAAIPPEQQKDLVFGQVREDGHVTTFPRTHIVGPGKGQLNQYEVQWKAEEAVRRQFPNAQFSNPAKQHNENWSFAHVGAETMPAKWRVDPRALDKAATHYGIQNPVQVRVRSGLPSARYKGVENGSHVIDAPHWVRPELANEHLWHELAHAKQQEEGMEFHPEPESLSREEYLALPEEVNARERMPDTLPFPVALPPVTSSSTHGGNDATPTQTQQEILA